MIEDDPVARVLASMPPPEVSGDFLARVNARIDETAGWLGLADYRLWTLRLAPVAAGLALLAILWPGVATPSSAGSTPSVATSVSESAASTSAASFSPSLAADWQQEVSADVLLDAALHPASGGARAR